MAKFNKEKALATIKSGDMDEIQDLIERVDELLNEKQYGLIWEKGGADEDSPFEPEHIVATCKKDMPYPKDRSDLSLRPALAKGNLLLEGDNFVWLTLLEQTHASKIDVIYIDPPYAGGRGLIYNDTFVDPNDNYKHSKWLSFMDNRLQLARLLLSETGIIMISIDDDEYATLKLLCDSIFNEENYIGSFIRKGTGGKQDSRLYASIHEYVLCYAKDISIFQSGKIESIVEHNDYKKVDANGRHYKTQLLRKWGDKDHREDRPNLFYPITDPDGNDFYPILPNGDDGRWRWGKDKMATNTAAGLVEFQKKKDGSWEAYERVYQPEQETKLKPYNTLIDDIGTENAVKDIFGNKVFDYPKPVKLIQRLIRMATNNQNATILDFFAGSGTTAHAVEELNKEDGGKRSWILITSNEDQNEDDGDPETGICRDITKPRIDTVITGIRPDGSKYSDGTNSGYQYFQYDFMPRYESREANQRAFFTPTKNVDAIVRIKYGVVLKELDRNRMAMTYESDDKQVIVFIKDVDEDLMEEFFDDEHAQHIVLANDIVDVDGVESDTIHSLIPSYEFFM